MDTSDDRAERFEAERQRLGAIAYRMLGSRDEAEDAVQETWLRLNRTEGIDSVRLGGWLTTVLSRICLDMLRARTARHEESLAASATDQLADPERESDPEAEAILIESVGIGLLVILDQLTPPERISFVLHDLFDVPFEEVAPIVGRTLTSVRQLASRARRRMRGAQPHDEAEFSQNRVIVDAFLKASRTGDFDALLTMLDPDVVFRGERLAGAVRQPIMIRSAPKVARSIALGSERGAGRVQEVVLASVDGAPGIIVVRNGRLFLVFTFTIVNGIITDIVAVMDPDRLRQLALHVLDS